MPMTPIASWSNVLPTRTSLVDCDESPLDSRDAVIARGDGRSFGDAAYVTDGVTLSTLASGGVCEIDARALTVTCSAGTHMGQLHRVLEAAGFQFPVYGGTQWATLGGAVAADVHGKNEVAEGSFGCHVKSILLDTPAHGRIECSRTMHPELYAATIGGMGLTGLIRSVTLHLRAKAAPAMKVSRSVVSGPEEMFERFPADSPDAAYCAWPRLSHPRARGLFCRASPAEGNGTEPSRALELQWPRVKLLNAMTAWALDKLMPLAAYPGTRTVHSRAFHYSGIHERFRHWNRFFGTRGFIEYHLALPESRFPGALHDLTGTARRRGISLLFAVVKRFGSRKREGLLSFPMEGYSLNFQTEATGDARAFLRAFTDRLIESGGRVYLAKDSIIDARQFARMYERPLEAWRDVVRQADPHNRIRSDLSARLDMKPWACRR